MQLKVFCEFLWLGCTSLLAASDPVLVCPRAVEWLFVFQELIDFWRKYREVGYRTALAVLFRLDGSLDDFTGAGENKLVSSN